MKYTVRITEILQKDVVIDAINDSEAIENVKRKYYNCDNVLISDDFEGVKFNIVEDNDDNRER